MNQGNQAQVQTAKKPSGFASWGMFAAGITLAAVAYFYAKPAHQGVHEGVSAEAHSKIEMPAIAIASQANTSPNSINSTNSINSIDSVQHDEPKAVAAPIVTTAITTTDTNTAATAATTLVDASAAKASETMAILPAPADAQILFASGQASLSAHARSALEPVIAKMKADPTTKAVLSGYTDATGNPEKNIALAKERAKAVREALRVAGVAGEADARIKMRKPEQITGNANPDTARRVDISVL